MGHMAYIRAHLRRRPIKASEFRRFYDRGDLPVQVGEKGYAARHPLQDLLRVWAQRELIRSTLNLPGELVLKMPWKVKPPGSTHRHSEQDCLESGH